MIRQVSKDVSIETWDTVQSFDEYGVTVDFLNHVVSLSKEFYSVVLNRWKEHKSGPHSLLLADTLRKLRTNVLKGKVETTADIYSTTDGTITGYELACRNAGSSYLDITLLLNQSTNSCIILTRILETALTIQDNYSHMIGIRGSKHALEGVPVDYFTNQELSVDGLVSNVFGDCSPYPYSHHYTVKVKELPYAKNDNK